MAKKRGDSGFYSADASLRRFSYLACFSLIVLMVFSINVSAGLNVTMSNQGADVRDRSTGLLLGTGNLTVKVYDASSGGNLLYSEIFTNAITNGKWNVMLGWNPSNPLPLEYGKKYYMDYAFNGQDVNFTNASAGMDDRQSFYSPLGDINSTLYIKPGSISARELSNLTNVSIGQKIFFGLGAIVENAVSGWLRISGNVNVTNNLTINERVGIGTFTPTQKLEVQGNVNVSSGGNISLNQNNQQIQFGKNNASIYWDGNQLVIKMN